MLHTMHLLLRRKESRRKLFLTLAVLLFIQIGSQIPVYGVNPDYFSRLLDTNAALGFLNSLTGNGLSGISFFALSITPYITASIIIQLMGIVIPALGELAKDGKSGKEKYERITWITAAVLGYVQAFSMAIGFGGQGLLKAYTVPNVLIAGFLLGTGALTVTLLGRLIDKKGIGNGISLILLCNILSSLPMDFYKLYTRFEAGLPVPGKILTAALIGAGFLLLYGFALFVNETKKQIPLQYASPSGRKALTGKRSLPLRLCLTGVMPVIFAQSLLSLPPVIGAIAGADTGTWPGRILLFFNSGSWFSPAWPLFTLGWLLYAVLIYFFAWFYAGIAFNTNEVAENLKRTGATIPGIRPGAPTRDCLNRQVKILLILGNTALLLLVTILMAVSGLTGVGSLSFGGTSILIITNVISETKEKLQAETLEAHTQMAIRRSIL